MKTLFPRAAAIACIFGFSSIFGMSSANAADYPEGISGEELRVAAAAVYANVKLTKDNVGDPLIEVDDEGGAFYIITYNCSTGELRRCQDIQFAAFIQGPYTDEIYPKFNEFHSKYIHGKSVMDSEKDIVFVLPTRMTNTSPEYITAFMREWPSLANLWFAEVAQKREATAEAPKPNQGAEAVLTSFKPVNKSFLATIRKAPKIYWK
jgi:hypothetical protein